MMAEAAAIGKQVACRYCYKQGLHWQQVGGNWRTFERDGRIHTCLQEALHNDVRRDLGPSPKQVAMLNQMHKIMRECLPAIAEIADDWADAVRQACLTPIKTNHEEQETMENFASLHYFTKNYVAIEVTFAEGGKPYFYKADSSLGIVEGDHVVVLVSDRPADDQLKVVPVVKVHADPVGVLSPNKRYKWIVSKISFTDYGNRIAAEDRFITGMRQLEARKHAESLVEAFRNQYGAEADKVIGFLN